MFDFWMFLIGITALSYSIMMTIDRFALTNYFKNPITYQMLTNAGSILIAIVLPFIFQISWTDYSLYATIYGLCLGLLYILLSFALQKEDVSIIGPLNGITPLFILVFAMIFLGESVSFSQMLGIFAMIVATIFLTYSAGSKFEHSKGVMYVLAFVVLLAISQVLIKFFIVNSDPYSMAFYVSLGMALSALVLMINNGLRNQFWKKDLKLPSKIVSLIFFGKPAFYLVAMLCFYSVLATTEVSLAGTLSNVLQPMFVLGISYAITKINPKILKEKFDNKTLMLKIIGVIFVCLGIYLLS